MEPKEARSIKFDPDKWEALTKVAKDEGTTTAALIRKAVYEFLKKHKGAK